MAYLAEQTSKTDYGVIKIGDFIDVTDGVVSLQQDVSPTADVTFDVVQATEIYDSGDRVVTSVNPNAGNGISLSLVDANGPDTGFTITNTGVLSLIAGSGISISASTGNITITSFGADLINVYGTTTNYTATSTDEYIGVSSTTNLTITLPLGASPGRVYTIKDEYGQGSGKITIQPSGGEKIDNKTNYIISVPNQSVSVVYRTSGWWII